MRENGGGGGVSHFFLSAGGLACTDRYHTWVPLRASKGQVGRYMYVYGILFFVGLFACFASL